MLRNDRSEIQCQNHQVLAWKCENVIRARTFLICKCTHVAILASAVLKLHELVRLMLKQTRIYPTFEYKLPTYRLRLSRRHIRLYRTPYLFYKVKNNNMVKSFKRWLFKRYSKYKRQITIFIAYPTQTKDRQFLIHHP